MCHRVICLCASLISFVGIVFCGLGLAKEPQPKSWDGKVLQYGKMHEAIGRKQDQGRVQLREVNRKPHLYAIAALQGLEGEVTIVDGNVTITTVDDSGQPRPITSTDRQQATMLAGAYVPTWNEHTVTRDVAPDDVDHYIAAAAAAAGIDTSEPFMFTVVGEFSDVRLHVINGACPIHARIHKIQLAKNEQPFESDLPRVTGTLVGVFAIDAVGNLTHPDTSTHTHIVYRDANSGKQLTGHLERIGLLKGDVLKLPR